MKRLFLMALIIISAFSFCSCSSNKAILKEEDIRGICELATLKCYYNNVAQIDKEKDNIFQKNRKMWIEYEGEATIGIDMSKLVVKISGDTVNITMPDAEILSISPIEETLNDKSYICSADGFLFKNKITTEDQQSAVTKGQEEMKKAVTENSSLFVKAEIRAKELIENYISKLNETTSKEYTIKWKN